MNKRRIGVATVEDWLQHIGSGGEHHHCDEHTHGLTPVTLPSNGVRSSVSPSVSSQSVSSSSNAMDSSSLSLSSYSMSSHVKSHAIRGAVRSSVSASSVKEDEICVAQTLSLSSVAKGEKINNIVDIDDRPGAEDAVQYFGESERESDAIDDDVEGRPHLSSYDSRFSAGEIEDLDEDEILDLLRRYNLQL